MSDVTLPPTTGTFAGMSEAQLRAAQVQAQQALIDLLTGSKPVQVSYSQGEGTRAVTFGRTDESKLRQLIAELNAALGQGRRRAIGVGFR